MLKIATELFSGALSRSIKGCSFDSMIPITSLMGIKVQDGVMSLYTSDNVNHLTIMQKVEGQGDFEAVIEAKSLYNLVSKTSAKTMVLELDEKNSTLKIEGNGNYVISLPTDENGVPLKYPTFGIQSLAPETQPIEFNLTELRTRLAINSASVPTSADSPEMLGYALADKVGILTTDAFKVCSTDMPTELGGVNLVLSTEFANLILGTVSLKGRLYVEGDIVVIASDTFVIYGPQMTDSQNFPIDGVKQFVTEAQKYEVKVDRKEVVEVLDRLNLFVSDYDKNLVQITFNTEEMVLNSRQRNGVEIVVYEESTLQAQADFVDFVISIDLVMLKEQLEAQTAQHVTIGFGSGEAIKVTSPGVVQIVSLLEED